MSEDFTLWWPFSLLGAFATATVVPLIVLSNMLQVWERTQILEEEILYGDITIEQAIKLNATTESLLILDVRSDAEFSSAHIGGAVNIPVDQIEERIGDLRARARASVEILVYCKSGVRSSTAMGILSENGFSKVYNMLGGIEAWKQAGHPTIGSHEGEEYCLPCAVAVGMNYAFGVAEDLGMPDKDILYQEFIEERVSADEAMNKIMLYAQEKGSSDHIESLTEIYRLMTTPLSELEQEVEAQ